MKKFVNIQTCIHPIQQLYWLCLYIQIQYCLFTVGYFAGLHRYIYMYIYNQTKSIASRLWECQTNNKTHQEEKSFKSQEMSAKNEIISMDFLKKVIQVVTKQYMRLQKQQLAFLVACAVVSAKHIRRFLRDLKIISMFFVYIYYQE